jgi:hypothetical protein
MVLHATHEITIEIAIEITGVWQGRKNGPPHRCVAGKENLWQKNLSSTPVCGRAEKVVLHTGVWQGR